MVTNSEVPSGMDQPAEQPVQEEVVEAGQEPATAEAPSAERGTGEPAPRSTPADTYEPVYQPYTQAPSYFFGPPPQQPGPVTQPAASPAATPDPKAEMEFLEGLSEIDRVNYLVNKAVAAQQVQLHQMQLMLFNNTDQQRFQSILNENPKLNRFSDLVETRFAEYLSKGQLRSREEILDTILGREARIKGSKVLTAAKEAGAANIKARSGTPGATASTVPAQRKEESARDRLMRRLREGAYKGF